ncbi:cell division protein FtsZ [Natronorarus salvus]|uniref:cell division protein FtsZ n=1 Tax=Natronorarus salvus TaxID=3117733 RepID=UPI002F26327F
MQFAPMPDGDERLRDRLAESEASVAVVGCGGAGSNSVDEIERETGLHRVACNTDAQHLLSVDADEKVLLGPRSTRGRGAGANEWVGEDAASESREAIRDAVEGSDLVFVTAGMGGGTGTGSAPVVARIARDLGAVTVAVVSTPFAAEGRVRAETAERGLERLRAAADTTIVVPNDRILGLRGELSVREAFSVSDRVLSGAVTGVARLLSTSGTMNVDFADLRTTLSGSEVAMFGLGEGGGGDAAREAVVDALRSPVLDADVSDASNALLTLTLGPGMSLREADDAVEELRARIRADAHVIWGLSIDDDATGASASVVLTGVDSPQILGPSVPAERGRTDGGTDRSEW